MGSTFQSWIKHFYRRYQLMQNRWGWSSVHTRLLILFSLVWTRVCLSLASYSSFLFIIFAFLFSFSFARTSNEKRFEKLLRWRTNAQVNNRKPFGVASKWKQRKFSFNFFLFFFLFDSFLYLKHIRKRHERVKSHTVKWRMKTFLCKCFFFLFLFYFSPISSCQLPMFSIFFSFSLSLVFFLARHANFYFDSFPNVVSTNVSVVTRRKSAFTIRNRVCSHRARKTLIFLSFSLPNMKLNCFWIIYYYIITSVYL